MTSNDKVVVAESFVGLLLLGIGGMQRYRNACFVLCMPRPELNPIIYLRSRVGGI